jgi:pimeloyl-ACP methyl ester carboxylesterase
MRPVRNLVLSTTLLVLLAACSSGATGPTDAEAVATTAAPTTSPAVTSTTAAAAGVDGTWHGTLAGLAIEFHLNDDDGVLSGSMDSITQGAFGIPVPAGELTGDQVTLDVPSVGGTFEGTLVADGNRIEGTWDQGVPIPLILERGPGEAVLVRPQEPQPPLGYLDEEVMFVNEMADITLAGTLTIPNGVGPAPAVVLISGSGPQDRNEEIFGHKPFLVIADYLTRRGVVVLRFDDRGVGGSGGDPAAATSEDFATDVLAAVDYVRSRPEVDPDRVGLVGHSEGGLIAPMATGASDDVAFLVLLAGPGVRGDLLLDEQRRLLLTAAGAPNEYTAWLNDLNRQAVTILEEEPSDVAAAKRINALAIEAFEGLDDQPAGVDPEEFAGEFELLATPWMRFFLLYDPAPALGSLRVPVLAINGDLDLQVSSAQNLAAIEAALQAGDNPDFEIVELNGLNHLFQTATTGLLDEYATIEETFAPEALQIIGDWILERFG